MPFRDLLNKLGQRMSENIAKSNQLSKDSGDIMMDRAIMANHPEVSGPRLPELSFFGQDGMLPAEKEYMDSLASGMMGSVGAVPKAVIAKSAPYMKGITEQVVKKAIPEAEGLAKTGFSHIKEFLAKQKLLNKRY